MPFEADTATLEAALSTENKDRIYRLAGALVILVLVLYELVRVFLLPGEILVYFTNDDTFYYLGIARNLVAGNGLSFDGLHQTNGFHPLWLGVSTLPFLLGAGTFFAWRMLMALTVLVWGLGLVFARSVLRRRFGERGALLPLILFAWPQLINNCLCGMEVTLTFTLVFAALELADRSGILKLEGSRRAEVGLGALLALVFLSRLDSFFVHGAAFVYLIAAYRRGGPGHGKGWRALAGRILRVFGPSVLALAGFLVWNQLTFGHLVPISAALKSSFPVPVFFLNHLVMYRELGVSVIAALVWVLLKRRELDPGTKILSWSYFGQLVFMVLFMKWATFSYYIVALGLPVLALAVGHLFGTTLKGRIKWQRAIVVTATVAVLAGQAISWTRVKLDFQPYTYQAALWASENTADDAVFAMTDCGVFGYFCGRSCINLDGLVNDYRYQLVLFTGRLAEYLKAQGVDYVVYHALPADIEDEYGEYRIVIPGRLYGGRSVIVLRRDDEVYRGEPYRFGYGSNWLTVIVWKVG